MKIISLQNRIAINIIVSTTILIMILCAIILLTFKIHIGKLDTTNLTIENVEYLFMILLRVCCVGCFFTLFLLFYLSRKIAQKSTKPIRDIIEISNTITHNNLSTRIPLPNNKDELYELSATINNLLDRIEYAIEREKSFTSYASHEFRTPLSVLKGTMEVLLRKPRSEAEYREKISACINEVDKLNDIVEQLLIVARYEEGKRSLSYNNHSLEDLVSNSICLFCDAILTKKMEVKIAISPQNTAIYTDEYSFTTILTNLISNAVKYSNDEGLIEIKANLKPKQLVVEIANTGYGIPEDEMEHIFEHFYRSQTHEHQHVNGFGLGLPIVKRFCSLLNIEIEIRSELGKQTVVKLIIPTDA